MTFRLDFYVHSVTLSLVICLEYSLCEKSNLHRGSIRSSGNVPEGRIVGGTPVKIERYPSSVILFNRGALCGSSVLNSWAVLTAAHCFDHSEDVDDMTIHADKVKKALLPTSAVWMRESESNFEVTGWGWTKYGGPVSELGLQMTSLRYIPLERCGKLHQRKFTPDMFCLYGDEVRDSCKGDSGGGVLWKGMIVGMVSHGDGCAKKDKPSLYANVWYFKNWIESKVKRYIGKNCKYT